jgi:hypothetical protein
VSKTKVKTQKINWKTAALKLAKCVVATMQTDGKIGMGSGLVYHQGVVERWDRPFIDALAYIGVELVAKPKATKFKPTKKVRK